MAYSFKHLTPGERIQILRYRIDHGYPLHAPPHPYQQEGYYLITAATFNHVPILTSFRRCLLFEQHLLDALKEIKAEAFAWSVLPNHYHVLLFIEDLSLVSNALQRLHGRTSRQWNLEDGETGKRKVWYEWSDRAIRGGAHFHRALNYIHFNPVKHGWVESVYDWPWSSLSLYEESHGRDWLRKNWKEYPPDQIGVGWDDFEVRTDE